MRILNDDIQFVLNRYKDFESIKVLTKLINTSGYDVISNLTSTSIDAQIECYSKKKIIYKNKITSALDLFYIILGLTDTGVKFNIPDDEKITKRDINKLSKNLEKIKTRLEDQLGETKWRLEFSQSDFEGKFFSISLVSLNKKLEKGEELGTVIRPLLIDKFE